MSTLKFDLLNEGDAMITSKSLFVHVVIHQHTSPFFDDLVLSACTLRAGSPEIHSLPGQ